MVGVFASTSAAVASAFFSWIPMLLRKNVIYQGHGLEWQRAKWSKEQRFIIKLMEKFVLSFSNNITMVSNEQSNYILSKYKKKAVTIPTAVYMPVNIIKDNSILNKYNLESNKYVLFLGRLVPEKNPDMLIYSYLNSKLEDIKLVIAGDDIRSPEYIAKIHNLAKNNKNIIFTGSVFGNDKHDLLNNCLAFCLPSSLEGLPISLLEAMSYKKLCISSDIESSKEALDSFGIFFKDKNTDELTERLNCLSTNMDFSLITNGAYSRIENYFTWEIVVEKYILFCNQILLKQKK
jgi:glycosyltransferase involved in cell wall biosynthesis